MFYNGIKIHSIEELEQAIANLSENEKQCLRNDFNGVPNTIPISVPRSVTPRQMRIALVMSGIDLNVIENMINSLPEPNRSVTRITWEYSVELQRDNPILNAMAPVLGLTSAQIDQLFILAGGL